MPAIRPRIGGPASKVPDPSRKPHSYVSKNASSSPGKLPDLSAGSCMTDRSIADLGMSTGITAQGIAERARAKDQCWSCPVVKACQRYVLAEEKPAGSWGGVWGGLDLWNRQGLEVIQQKVTDEKSVAKVVAFDIDAVVSWTERHL